MVAQGILKVVTIFAIGAILYNVISHPKGTQALVGSVTSFLETGLSYSARGTGPGGGRRGAGRRR